MGGKVLLTDLSIYLSMIEENVANNMDIITGEVAVQALDWANDVPEMLSNSADVVLISDCIYYEMSLGPLVKVIKTVSHENSNIVISYEERKDKMHLYKAFCDLLMEENFVINIDQSILLDNGNTVFILNIQSNCCNKQEIN